MTIRLAGAASVLAVLLLFSAAPAQERPGRSWSGNGTSLTASQIVSGDYFAFGEVVQISGTINGDLYASGGQVVIDGRVNGDILVAGGRVSLSGIVSQDVRAAGALPFAVAYKKLYRTNFNPLFSRDIRTHTAITDLFPFKAARAHSSGSGNFQAMCDMCTFITGSNESGEDYEKGYRRFFISPRMDF